MLSFCRVAIDKRKNSIQKYKSRNERRKKKNELEITQITSRLCYNFVIFITS